jgi:hypothetical protein
VTVRDPAARELAAVAPIITLGTPPQLVGSALVVANGERTMAVTSAEVLRPFQGQPIAIATKLDGSAHVQVVTWGMGRYSGIALVELSSVVLPGHDVVPLDIGHLCASVDTRGSPAAVVTIESTPTGLARRMIAVHVDADDGGGMSDQKMHLASPVEAADAARNVEGSPVFAWFPPDSVLGRPSEVLAVGVAYPYRVRTSQPRGVPVLAEVIGLEDLGRALLALAEPQQEDDRPELAQVAGEIADKGDARDPLAGLDE